MATSANTDCVWHPAGGTGRRATTISLLPDNVLLEIFCFSQKVPHPYWGWHVLVHVCRGWRQVVFASPLRLDLRIICTSTTPVRKNLGIWPALPISVKYHSYGNKFNKASIEDNVVYALEHTDRVCDVTLNEVTGSDLEKISTVMRAPFPVLTRLQISSSYDRGIAPALPVEFLGGSAPRLRTIWLSGIPFPALPTLLLTTNDLVYLYLYNIPRTGYISTEAMVVGLATLPRLRTFGLEFRSATPRPDRIYPPPATRTVLPALTEFYFQGASEYVEDFVARIDAPQLDKIYISYLNQLVDFQVPQLAMFIDRSVGPKLSPFRNALVTFRSSQVIFGTHRSSIDSSTDPHYARTNVLCHGIDWQVSHIAQVVSHFSPTLSNVKHLKLEDERRLQLEGTDDIEWLHLLHQFPTVRTLHVSRRLAGLVALALEDIAFETVADVLPSLNLIYFQGQPASCIERFVAARQLSGCPVTVIETKKEFYEGVKSYDSE